MQSHAKKTKFVYYGGVSEGRGIFQLIENWSSLGPNCSLTIFCPECEFKNKIKEKITKINGHLQKKIEIKDSLPAKNIYKVLNKYDVGIIPYTSICTNDLFCCPNKAGQYMKAGLAILVNDLPNLSELIKTSQSGLISKFDNLKDFQQAIKILCNPINLQRFKRKSSSYHLKEYNWQNKSKNFYKVLQQLSHKNNGKVIEQPSLKNIKASNQVDIFSYYPIANSRHLLFSLFCLFVAKILNVLHERLNIFKSEPMRLTYLTKVFNNKISAAILIYFDRLQKKTQSGF